MDTKDHRIISMSLQEWKEYEPPHGWSLLHVSGYRKFTHGMEIFIVSVTIEKVLNGTI